MKKVMMVMVCVFSIALAEVAPYSDSVEIADRYDIQLSKYDHVVDICIDDNIIYIRHQGSTMTPDYNPQFWDAVESVLVIALNTRWYPDELYIIWDDWTAIFSLEELGIAWQIIAVPDDYDAWLEDDPYDTEMTESQFPIS